MRKEFISFDTVRDNAIKLSYTIYKTSGIPDVIYVLLRGGAPMGNIISEYFKLLSRKSRPVYYAAVVARAYQDVMQHNNNKVIVDGWTYSPDNLRQGDKILFVDDIFDTGRTMNHLVDIIIKRGIPRSDIKIAVHDYKVRLYEKKELPILPDYYCRKHVLKEENDDFWIHYLSHELQSLTEKEYSDFYDNGDEELKKALNEICLNREPKGTFNNI